jgi:propanol-preferring alcohol dehydrogenase
LEAYGQPLRLVEKPDPVPGAGEVVIDVKGSGLCHSDVMAMQDLGTTIGLNTILGHEMAGVISAVGPGVTEWQVGDRASVCPTGGKLTPGFFYDGGFADKHLSTLEYLVRVPDGIPWELAAMMTDAGMTSYHALVKRGGLQSGQKVGIIGLGGLGQIAARVAVLIGADVHVAEPKRDVWDLGRRLGVTDFVADAADWAGHDFDLIVDYAGFGTTTAAAIKAVRFDGAVVVVGLGVQESTISIGAMVSNKVRLLASRGGTTQDIAELYEFVARGELTPELTTIGFDDIPAGIQQLAEGKVTGRLVAVI